MARPEDTILEEMVNKGIGVSGLTSRAIQQSNAPDLRSSLNTSLSSLENERNARVASARGGAIRQPQLPQIGVGGTGVEIGKPTAFLTYGTQSGAGNGQLDRNPGLALTYSRGTGDVLSDSGFENKVDINRIRQMIEGGTQVLLPGTPNMDPLLKKQLEEAGVRFVDTGTAAKLRAGQTRDVAGTSFLTGQVGNQVGYPDPTRIAQHKINVANAVKAIKSKPGRIGTGGKVGIQI